MYICLYREINTGISPERYSLGSSNNSGGKQ